MNLLGLARLLAALALATSAGAQTAAMDPNNWGAVTAPVYGISETSLGGATDLFAGPNKFGSYYAGVLPNGRIVKPAGISIQVGMSPLGAALTPDGKFLVTSNDNERDPGEASLHEAGNKGGYSLSVIDTASMAVVSRIASGRYFVGIAISGRGPYTVWVSAGPDNQIRLFEISADGAITAGQPATITIAPILPRDAGYVSNYTPAPAMNANDSAGNKPPVPAGFTRTGSTAITYPAGMALSPDGRFLYVACNGDNSVAAVDTAAKRVVRQAAAGYFPYGVSVSAKGDQVLVSNWGVSEYRFTNPTYDAQGRLAALRATDNHTPFGYYVPWTNSAGDTPLTSSISLYNAPGGDGSELEPAGSIYQGKPLDELYQVGDTHPSATAIVRRGDTEVLYVAKANSDALGRILLGENRALPDFDLSPIPVTAADGHAVHGAYPNALAVSPDQTRLYVAEAGLNSVAVVDTTDPLAPVVLGRIPTGWYPTAVAVSPDGEKLFVANAKGIGEDINPRRRRTIPRHPRRGCNRWMAWTATTSSEPCRRWTSRLRRLATQTCRRTTSPCMRPRIPASFRPAASRRRRSST